MRLFGASIALLLVAACRPATPPARPSAQTTAASGPSTPAAPSVAAPGAPVAPLSPAQIASRATPSVVLIRTPRGLGTGFVVSPDGRIATNLHVIRGAREATVTLADGRVYAEVIVMGVDAAHDLALLRVPQRGLAALPLGDSGAVKPGERVVAIGHPLGLGNTVSDGLVSAIRVVDEDLTLLQISAPISEGSSGGPLLDEAGRVIGVSTLVITRGQNLNFGIPIAYLSRLLQNDTGVPLATFAAKRAPRRAVPSHGLELLTGCSTEQLTVIVASIERAIHVGAPLYNQGNIDACFRIYEGAAVELQDHLAGCAGPKKALADGVARAAGQSEVDAKAWAMRDAFDGLLDVIEKQQRGAGAGPDRPGRPQPRHREVPEHPLAILADCDPASQLKVIDVMSHAIDLGAPLYNQGQHEACFRIYEDAALSLQRELPACEGVKKALGAGLLRARTIGSFDDRAWAMRDAFDGLADVLERARKK